MPVEIGLPNSFAPDTSVLDLTFDPSRPATADDVLQGLLVNTHLGIRNDALRHRLAAELAELLQRLGEDGPGDGYGLLLELRIYSDGHGPIAATEGGIVLPIGSGPRPVDCLAAHLRHPRLAVQPPDGLKDVGYFLWVEADALHDVRIHTIAQPSKAALWQLGRKEMLRLDLLERTGGLASDLRIEARRARYWQDVRERHAARLAARGREADFDRLVKEMAEAERAFQEAEARSRALFREIAEQRRSRRLGEAISALQSLLDIALSSRTLLSSEAEAPLASLPRPTPAGGDMSAWDAVDGWLEEQEALMRAREEALRLHEEERQRRRIEIERTERDLRESARDAGLDLA